MNNTRVLEDSLRKIARFNERNDPGIIDTYRETITIFAELATQTELERVIKVIEAVVKARPDHDHRDPDDLFQDQIANSI